MRHKIIFFIVLIFFLSVNSANAQFQPLRNLSVSNQQQSLDAVDKQINDIRNQQANNSLSVPNDVPVNEEKNNSQVIGFILGGILVLAWGVSGLYKYTRPENVKERQERREEERTTRAKNIKLAKEERERRQQEVLEQRQKRKEEELEKQQQIKSESYHKYKKWRTGLEQMPKYETWRQQVFSKYGKRCERNGEGCTKIENLEIHHKKSLYSIYKEGGFDSIMSSNGLEKALDRTIGYNELWDPDKGSVLCHECHERQDSSQTFLLNNKQN